MFQNGNTYITFLFEIIPPIIYTKTKLFNQPVRGASNEFWTLITNSGYFDAESSSIREQLTITYITRYELFEGTLGM